MIFSDKKRELFLNLLFLCVNQKRSEEKGKNCPTIRKITDQIKKQTRNKKGQLQAKIRGYLKSR